MSGDYPKQEPFVLIKVSQRYCGESAHSEVHDWYESFDGAITEANRLFNDKNNLVVATYVASVISRNGSVT